MPRKEASFSSPRITREVRKTFGKKAESVRVRMRSSKDVYRFVSKVEKAHKKAAKSKLAFD